ncbi:uncharacterized protein LAESUDRAFT_706136 [Laetiporus sulphureus 93-53]|uniref:Pentacotripeptide-repeat region of PRORP domain-containing protein n=1 Tax=Laetiporus sulphureus 93-53 TaxID=1314785 RepID=A0A165C9R5_9APHY|nr:uncharacterized protein LAESUDRAFT_706136 [Laetiporus sulphureus 93-53]KZT02441.1 hypothetical protein LAESUDRAFT_706136 [Laetiporus sulphureus 93-53]
MFSRTCVKTGRAVCTSHFHGSRLLASANRDAMHSITSGGARESSHLHVSRQLFRSPGSSMDAVTLGVVNEFHKSVADGDINAIRRDFSALRLLVNPVLNKMLAGAVRIEDFQTALEIFADSATVRDISLMKDIFSFVRDLSDTDDRSQLHDAIYRRLVGHGFLRAAFNWLAEEPVQCTPTHSQWDSLIDLCIQHWNLQVLFSALEMMSRLGCPPVHATYENILTTLTGHGITLQFRTLSLLFRDMKRAGLKYNPNMRSILQNHYRRFGSHGLAAEAEQVYGNICGIQDCSPLPTSSSSGSGSSEGPKTDTDRNMQLGSIAGEKGKWSAVGLYENYKKAKFLPSQETLQCVLGRSDSIQDLRRWENVFLLRAEAPAWAQLIRNSSAKGNVKQTIAIYKEALSTLVHPTAAMLHPVLRVLCSNRLSTPTDSEIRHALDLYAQFKDQLNTGADEDAGSKKGSSRNSLTPDAPIFNTLLRALSSSSNMQEFFPVASSLLEEMESLNVTMDAMTTTSLIVLLMRCSPSYLEAFEMYRRISRPGEGLSILDEEGFVAVLAAFCKLSVIIGGIPPTDLYFSIVKDMRKAGYLMNAKVYTIMLQQLATLATKILREKDSDDQARNYRLLIDTIQRVHDFLVLDPSINPDVALWNQLMDTYQRARCYTDAFRVWDMLTRSKQIDNASVSIILDACAYSGSYGLVMRLWDSLTSERFPLNQDNWYNWLECLCRLGKLNDALRTMCLEMPNVGPGIKPDEKCAKLVINFASRTNQEEEIRMRIKTYLPDLWMTLLKSEQS